MRLLVFVTLLLSQSLAAQSDIFPGDRPQLVPLWHRLADYSPRLRAVEACAISPDGRRAASVSKFGYNVMVWRVADGHLLWEGRHESEVECLAWSPDGHRLATGGEDYFLRVWDAATGRPLAAIEQTEAGFDGLAWSPDGGTIAGGDEAGNVVFYAADSYAETGRVKVGSTVNSLEYTAAGDRLLVGGNIQTPDPDGPGGKRYEGFAKILTTADNKVIAATPVLPGSVKSVRWGMGETFFATGGFDSTVRLYDPAARLVRSFPLEDKVEAVAFSPDGHYLITGGHGLGVVWLRLADGEVAYRQASARTEYFHFSSDGRLLLTGHEDSGLLSCYLLLSDVQARGNYQQVADKQLNNRDLKPKH